MPHGNKKSFNNNKKKKASQPRNVDETATKSTVSPLKKYNRRVQQLPSPQDEYSDGECPPDTKCKKVGLSTIYGQYKEATGRFKAALEQMVPSSIFSGNNVGVKCWLDAVDYLYAQAQDANDKSMNFHDVDLMQAMDDLNTAISFRRQVAKAFYQDDDEGHSYFLAVLNYCWVVLKPILAQFTKSLEKQKRQQKNKDNEPDPVSNRFSVLSTADTLDDSETIDMTESISEIPPRPVPPRNVKLSLEDLTEGDDRFCASLLLLSMEEMMQSISLLYRNLKQKWRAHFGTTIPSDTFVEDIMEAATYVNLAIQEILILEEELNAKYPYLNTVYRMMAFLNHPHVIAGFTNTVLPLLSDRASFLASRDAVAFMGDLFESEFRCKDDKSMRTETIVAAFCTKWNLEATSISHFISLWTFMGSMEARLIEDVSTDQKRWLASFKNIGDRDHSIINTVHQLQFVGFYMNTIKAGKLESMNAGSKKFGEMDEYMFSRLNTLLHGCSLGMLSNTEANESELLTFYTPLKSFTLSPAKAVPWSLAFAVHALRMSFVEMQGDNDYENLGTMARASYKKYFDQINSIIPHHTDKRERQHLNYMHYLRLSVPTDCTPAAAKLTWSPLCSGLAMKYVSFYANLNLGTRLVNRTSQLRLVLHLHNAFVQVGALRDGGIPFLDWLHDTFKDNRCVWGGKVPKSGEFVKRWFVANGTSAKGAQNLANGFHRLLGSSTMRKNISNDTAPREMIRLMGDILPADIAVCYRRICLRDFGNIEDPKLSDFDPSQHISVVNELTVRAKAIIDTMKKEQSLLAANYALIGHLLQEHIIEVLETSGVLQEIEAPFMYGQNAPLIPVIHAMVEHVIAPLDVAPTLDAMGRFDPRFPLLARLFDKFVHIFSKIKLSDVQFFTPSA